MDNEILKICRHSFTPLHRLNAPEMKQENALQPEHIVKLADCISRRETGFVETKDYIYMYVALPTHTEIADAAEPTMNIINLNIS